MRYVFPIIPAGSGPVWFFVGISALLLAMILLFSWVAWSTQHSRVEIAPEGLRLVGDLWGRHIPGAALNIEQARPVNLDEERSLRPVSRRMGTGLGGFASGWFRLANGDKALIYLTDRRRVALVPTTRGYVVMVSVEDPERFVRVLRETVRR